MPTYAFAAPVLPGKLPAVKEMISLMLGDRRSEAEALRKTAGLDREQVFLHSTPMGDFAIVVWDTSDFKKVIDVFGTDGGEFAQWFRGCIKEIHGFDIADKANAPDVKLIGDWKASDWSFDSFEGAAVCFPIAEGKWSAAEAFTNDIMSGAHSAEYASTRGDLGIKRQAFYGMHTPQGDIAIMYGEGKDGWFPKAFQTNATSQDPFFAWFREGVMTFAGVPLFEGAQTPKVEQLFHMTVNVPATV